MSDHVADPSQAPDGSAAAADLEPDPDPDHSALAGRAGDAAGGGP